MSCSLSLEPARIEHRHSGDGRNGLSLRDVLLATQGEARGFSSRTPESIAGISIDTRTLQPGELFWALPGAQRDGHAFVAEAHRRGACAAVVRRDWPAQGAAGPMPLIRVDDTLQALARLASWHRRHCAAVVIGITGSVGKTTTRTMIDAVLSRHAAGIESPRNYNNHIGVPLTLLALRPFHRFGVVELATSAPGEIGRLASISRPEIGVVTAVAPAHWEGFGSLEATAREKRQLVEHLPKEGFAVLNGDDPHVQTMKAFARCRSIFVGKGPHNDVRATQIVADRCGLSFRAGRQFFQLPALGRHHLGGALAALAVAREFGLKDAEVSEALRHWSPPPGRCRPVALGPVTLIDDTYNANPTSVRAACDLLAESFPSRRRILVLGDMLQLGKAAGRFHEEVGAYAAGSGIEWLLAVGRHADAVVHGALGGGLASQHALACRELPHACRQLAGLIDEGDVVLVKGSRGMRMERVVEWLQTTFGESRLGFQATHATTGFQ